MKAFDYLKQSSLSFCRHTKHIRTIRYRRLFLFLSARADFQIYKLDRKHLRVTNETRLVVCLNLHFISRESHHELIIKEQIGRVESVEVEERKFLTTRILDKESQTISLHAPQKFIGDFPQSEQPPSRINVN